jgi:hypothetical protein
VVVRRSAHAPRFIDQARSLLHTTFGTRFAMSLKVCTKSRSSQVAAP